MWKDQGIRTLGTDSFKMCKPKIDSADNCFWSIPQILALVSLRISIRSIPHTIALVSLMISLRALAMPVDGGGSMNDFSSLQPPVICILPFIKILHRGTANVRCLTIFCKQDIQVVIYDGYWEDVCTIEAFYHANLESPRSQNQISRFQVLAASVLSRFSCFGVRARGCAHGRIMLLRMNRLDL
ncbi:hypothetical protein L6452_25027 [Arctium lappa]|uniref:Uncharacterized protein n=1 Tax=Arctium lappa TaxID=4217 RepID=A0ACB9AAQ0_ARCLA|nr:hypothetical protein L6452_25027 [Arctium lappa]